MLILPYKNAYLSLFSNVFLTCLRLLQQISETALELLFKYLLLICLFQSACWTQNNLRKRNVCCIVCSQAPTNVCLCVHMCACTHVDMCVHICIEMWGILVMTRGIKSTGKTEVLRSKVKSPSCWLLSFFLPHGDFIENPKCSISQNECLQHKCT